MSEVYWGIVGGLAALVAIFFVCIEILYSNVKPSPKASSNGVDDRPLANPQPAAGHRRAA
jgi:hypothetical protein